MQQNRQRGRWPYTVLTALLFVTLLLPQTTAAQSCDSLFVADSIATDSVALPAPLWTCVKVNASMPKSFRARKTNLITRSDSLQPVFDTLCHSGRPLRVLHLGDSHVAGKTFPQTIKAQLEKAWGTDSTGHGISYSYMAKNGATALNFLTDVRLQLIADKQPDLIILSFGTNECHGMGYREEQHQQELSEVVDRLRNQCPHAAFLLTTPPGDYLVTRRVTYPLNKKTGKKQRVVRRYKKPNPMSARCATLLDKYAAEEGFAVWNLNAITGGPTAVQNWIAAHMMRSDRIHFTPAGYELQGKLFCEALLSAYNDYINAHNAAVASTPTPIDK